MGSRPRARLIRPSTHTHTHKRAAEINELAAHTHRQTHTHMHTHALKRAAGINRIAEPDASAAVYPALFCFKREKMVKMYLTSLMFVWVKLGNEK